MIGNILLAEFSFGIGYKFQLISVIVNSFSFPLRPAWVFERVAVEWLNSVLDQNIPILADELANINADAAVNTTRMKIK